MHNIVYWVPDDRVGSQQQLVYLLGHESREAAKESFAGFVVPSDEFNFIGFRIAAVPEPASLGLAATGGLAAVGWTRLSRRRAAR